MYTQCTDETNTFARETFVSLFSNDKIFEKVIAELSSDLAFLLTLAATCCMKFNLCHKEFITGALWMYAILQKCEQEELERIGKLSV